MSLFFNLLPLELNEGIFEYLLVQDLVKYIEYQFVFRIIKKKYKGIDANILVQYPKIVKYLIEEGLIDINEYFRYAALLGHFETVKILLEKGANVHADNDFSLRLSAEKGQFEIVKLLVENGANIHAEDEYSLRMSAENGYTDIVRYLVYKGADIHSDRNYVLRICAEKKNYDMVKFLIENGADLDYALRWSAANGHFKVVKLLVENGANVHTEKHNCALRISAQNRHFEIVKYLVRKGADLDNAIRHSRDESTRNILRKYIKKEMDKYPINHKTETVASSC